MDNFIKIAITPPYFFPNESKLINNLLSQGEADLLHIRKPAASYHQIETLINNIDGNYHDRIKLHDHFELISKYKLGGIHLNSRNPIPPAYAKTVSKSIHSLEEINAIKDFDYFFISPVFDSISKQGYKAKFDLQVLSESIIGKNAIALGGVTPDKFSLLKELGFIGAAMIGHYFNGIKNK